MGANSVALEHSRRHSVGQKVFVLTWGIRSIRVSAEERSCLEGVHTVRIMMGDFYSAYPSENQHRFTINSITQ